MIHIFGLLLSFILIARRRYLHGESVLYAIAYASSMLFGLTIVASFASQLVIGWVSDIIVTAVLVAFSTLTYVTNHKKQAETGVGKLTHMTVLTCILCLVLISVTGFNALRYYPHLQSLPIVGTNDDNANHMALTAMSIRDKNFLFGSASMRRMITDGLALPATQWYPPGLYINARYLYEIIYGAKLNLASLFNLYAIWIPFQLVIFLIFFYTLVDKIYKTKTIWSFPILFALGFFVVLSEFFVKLYLYGFYAQLVAYNLLLMLIIETVNLLRRNEKFGLSQAVFYCLILFALGASYYLFIPLGAAIYFYLHINISKRPRYIYLPYVALVASTVPLFMYTYGHSFHDQTAVQGIAFVSFTGMMTALCGILGSVLMRGACNKQAREIGFILSAITIALMVYTAIGFFPGSNNLGYYFFKSYWTLGLTGLPLLTASLAYLFDSIAKNSVLKGIFILMVSICISAASFYYVFSLSNMSTKGYDVMLYVYGGQLNYFPGKLQGRWVDIHRKLGDTNGTRVYALGKWGEMLLGYAVFGDAPYAVKRSFANGISALSSYSLPIFASSFAQELYDGKDVYLIENSGTMSKTIIKFVPDSGLKKKIEQSGALDL